MDDLAEFLIGNGYAVIVSEWHPVVEYGQSHDWRRVFSYGTEVAGDGAWGNLVAVEPADAGATLRALERAGRLLGVRRAVDLVRGAATPRRR